MSNDISVIIPVYNNTKEIGMTLNSLRNQNYPPDNFEIIIADDGSPENIKDYLDKKSPAIPAAVRYFRQDDRGFRPGAARNMGIRNANGKICLFIDCGVLLEKNCLQRHFDIHAKGSGNEVVIGYVYGMDKDSDLNEMREIVDGNSVEDAVVKMHERNMIDGRESLYREHGDDLSLWPAPWIALWSLHFSAPANFLKTNSIYFDDYFNTWGCEDNDFGIQLHKKNCRYVLNREAKSIHYPPKVRSYDRLKDPEFKNNFKKNQQYIVNKYPEDEGVKLWYEAGMFKANRILLERSGK
ncbi:MAG: glycosyltransferase [Treponema sp.]|jgi:glycosyltransferase involved in cell wall biosynthesis|nr:glycosyltransferase [Treponema sp.]